MFGFWAKTLNIGRGSVWLRAVVADSVGAQGQPVENSYSIFVLTTFSLLSFFGLWFLLSVGVDGLRQE